MEENNIEGKEIVKHLTAQEYFDAYHLGDSSEPTPETVKALTNDLIHEMKSSYQESGIRSSYNLTKCVKTQLHKWNKICKLVEDTTGKEYLKYNALKELMVNLIPDFKGRI